MQLHILIAILTTFASLVEGRRSRRFKKKGDAQIPVESGPDPWAVRKAEFSRRHGILMGQLSGHLLGPLNALLQREAQANTQPFRNARPNVKWTPIPCNLLDIRFERVRTIHNGKRNSVYLVEDIKTGKLYAHKTFDQPDEYTAELTVGMVTGNHPYIVQPICIRPHDTRPGIVFEYVSGMTSTQFAMQQHVGYGEVQRMSAQLMEAIAYIHYQGYIHADMKPDNVMITPEGNIKIIDLGFALKLPYTKGNRGTPATMAPELISAVPGPLHEGIDWWAYGSTVAIWNSLIISRSKNGRFIPLLLERSALHHDEMFQFGRCPAEFNDDLKAFLALFLQADPDRRAFNTADQVEFLKQTPYLRPRFPRLHQSRAL